MDLLRFLVLLSMKHNFFVRARHVPGVSNDIADALSRFQDERFRTSAPNAQKTPCTIPPSLMTLIGAEVRKVGTGVDYPPYL